MFQLSHVIFYLLICIFRSLFTNFKFSFQRCLCFLRFLLRNRNCNFDKRNVIFNQNAVSYSVPKLMWHDLLSTETSDILKIRCIEDLFHQNINFSPQFVTNGKDESFQFLFHLSPDINFEKDMETTNISTFVSIHCSFSCLIVYLFVSYYISELFHIFGVLFFHKYKLMTSNFMKY